MGRRKSSDWRNLSKRGKEIRGNRIGKTGKKSDKCKIQKINNHSEVIEAKRKKKTV